MLDAPEAAGGEGGLLRGRGNGAGRRDGEGRAGGEGAEEAGDEGGHGGRHLKRAQRTELLRGGGRRGLFMKFAVEGTLYEVGLRPAWAKLSKPRGGAKVS